MSSNFSYATVEDLNKYFNKSSDYDNKSLITTGWTSLGSNRYIAYGVGRTLELYRDGARLHNYSDTTTGTGDTTATATALDEMTDDDADLFNTVTVDDASDFPAGTLAIFGSTERFLITGVSSNDLTIVRGQTGTSISSHAIDTVVTTLARVDADGQWFQPINATLDVWEDYVILYSTTDPNDLLLEKGTDSHTFMDQTLVDASLELHNYIDARYSTPIEKAKQIDIDTAVVSVAEEYDPIVIKSVCYIAASNIIRAKEGQSEEADYYHALVTNIDRTGLVDRLNDGIYKLSFETDANDKKGKIKYRSVAGTIDIVEIAGSYTGELYDLLKIEIDTTGAYGVSKYKTHYYGNDKLYGSTSGTDTITGGLQELIGGSGLYVRFQGASATDGDIWEIEVAGSQKPQTNKTNATIEMKR